MRRCFPNVPLVDTAETLGEFRYRLYGTAVSRGFEHDRSNIFFFNLPSIENYDEVYAGYWQTCRSAMPVYFHGRIVSSDINWRMYSRLSLPLSSAGDRVDMILGGIVFYTVGTRSQWLGRDVL